MAKTFEGIDAELEAWIRAQPLFFVSTAPADPGGHLNLSPKGLNHIAVLDPGTVAYLDLTGSGVETIAHLRDNGRIVLMLCAFQGPPRIVRLHGRGEVHEAGTAGFDEMAARFPDTPGARSIVRVKLDRVSDSCGFGVPLMQFEGDRDHMPKWVERKEAGEGVATYRAEKNATSIDGLRGLSFTDGDASKGSVEAPSGGAPS